MPIKGISIHKEEGYVVCCIDDFSDELKGLIRSELNYICHGKNQVDEDTLSFYSYERTIKDFFNRYSKKKVNTKKGMMGELIAHLIIDQVLDDLKKIAIFFNKEEGSIKKGFDLTYVNIDGTAIWSLSFEVKSNDVDSLYSDIEKNITIIKSFLKEKGFDESEINIAPVNIYQDTFKDSAFRYNSTNQVSVYTKKVDLAKVASNGTLLLVKKGVVLSQNSISFEFSDLNGIKPEMLAEPIKNAKDTAKQFADNSNSTVGSVTRGNQGVFEIEDKDPGSPEFKKIRLVSTLRFLLK